LADLLRVPIVGCASHRLNKAAQEYYSSDPELVIIIDKVNDLMLNLRTLKNASILRTINATNGVLAKTRNATRWSSEFWMLTRFFV
jgi:deoxyinosine 3'endonuclease (endonuclease V)